MVLREECVKCAWLGRLVLRAETKGCTLTRMLIASSMLNEEDELVPLRDLLDGRAGDAIDVGDLIPQIRSLDEPFFRGLTHVQALLSPGGLKWAVRGEIRSLFGRVRYVGFLLSTGDKLRIIGQGVIGSRVKNEWVLDAEVDFP
jgi:hypothetical protein